MAERNEKRLDHIHKNLCFLTQNKSRMLEYITHKRCSDLNGYKTLIIDNDLIGVHFNRFGIFDVKDLMEKNPHCFRLLKMQDPDRQGEAVQYTEGQERWRCWWGQPRGPFHVEIGIKEGQSPALYIMEGDSREFARMTFYSLESGIIEHHDFVQVTQEAIYQRLRLYIYDFMIERHPIMPIHKKLVDLTGDPQTMLNAITRGNSPNLFELKDRIERACLIE